jgi:hypothetical protein
MKIQENGLEFDAIGEGVLVVRGRGFKLTYEATYEAQHPLPMAKATKPAKAASANDSARLAEITRKFGNTGTAYAAEFKANRQRIGDALAKLKLRGLVRGGNGQRLEAVSTEVVL